MKILEIILLLLHLLSVVRTQTCKLNANGIHPQESWSPPKGQLNSANSKLRVTLRAEIGLFNVQSWLSLYRRTFNQQIPAPTIRVKQGDELAIDLINKLTNPDINREENELRYPNSTNLHLHGLHIDSKAPGDDVFIHIKPTSSYSYSYKIEDDQPPGTYWYHPHLHGSTILQVNSGMAGMLIVEDNEDTSGQLKAVSCPWNCQLEKQLIFQPTLLYENENDAFAELLDKYQDMSTAWPWGKTKDGCPPNGQNLTSWLHGSSGLNNFTTNGKLNPYLSIDTGDTYRFRMVNAGGSAVLELDMVKQNTDLRDCEYKEIAMDGVYRDSPVTPSGGKTLLPPGGRSDWLVRCNRSGTYVVRSWPMDSDTVALGEETRRYKGILLTVKVIGSTKSGSIGNVPLPKRPHYVNFPTRSDLNTSFSIEVGPQLTLNRERFSGASYFRHLENVDEQVQWNLLNTSPKEGHPIHIHVNHFKVVSYNPYIGPIGDSIDNNNFPNDRWLLFSQNTSLDNRVCYYQHKNYDHRYGNRKLSTDTKQSYQHEHLWNRVQQAGYTAPGTYLDTIMVPPLSNITIQFMTHKFTGVVVIHCHFLRHEDNGMMMVVDIVKPGDRGIPVHPESGNALPGQCIGGAADAAARKRYDVLLFILTMFLTSVPL